MGGRLATLRPFHQYFSDLCRTGEYNKIMSNGYPFTVGELSPSSGLEPGTGESVGRAVTTPNCQVKYINVHRLIQISITRIYFLLLEIYIFHNIERL